MIIIYTHGNEKIGEEIVERLKSKGLDKFFDCLTANPEAAKKNIRFMEADLNRSYPGKENSNIYELRQASKNLKIARKYKFVIDIHEASSGINDFIIIPRERGVSLFPLNLINLDTVLFWPDPSGPISQILDNSIELEFGTKDRDRNKIISKAIKILEDFIKQKPSTKKKKFYYVYGKLMLEDFQKIAIKESFYPLLTGQYIKDGIICYKMRRSI